MRKIIITVAALTAFMLWPTAALGSDHKVTICHVPPGNPENAHTITIAKAALKAHLGENDEGLHGGDHYGPCTPIASSPTPSIPAGSPSPTPSSTPTITPPSPTPTGSASSTQVTNPRMTLPPTDTEAYTTFHEPDEQVRYLILMFGIVITLAAYIAFKGVVRRRIDK